MKAARAKAKIEFGTLDHNFASYTTDVGSMYVRLGKYDKALPLLIESKNILKTILGSEHADYASSLDNLAYLYQKTGKYDRVVSLLIEAKNIREKVLLEATRTPQKLYKIRDSRSWFWRFHSAKISKIAYFRL